MTIKELIKELQKFNTPDQQVLVARDEEGNGYGDIGEIAFENGMITIYPNNNQWDMEGENMDWEKIN